MDSCILLLEASEKRSWSEAGGFSLAVTKASLAIVYSGFIWSWSDRAMRLMSSGSISSLMIGIDFYLMNFMGWASPSSSRCVYSMPLIRCVYFCLGVYLRMPLASSSLYLSYIFSSRVLKLDFWIFFSFSSSSASLMLILIRGELLCWWGLTLWVIIRLVQNIWWLWQENFICLRWFCHRRCRRWGWIFWGSRRCGRFVVDILPILRHVWWQLWNRCFYIWLWFCGLLLRTEWGRGYVGSVDAVCWACDYVTTHFDFYNGY